MLNTCSTLNLIIAEHLFIVLAIWARAALEMLDSVGTCGNLLGLNKHECRCVLGVFSERRRSKWFAS